MAILLPILKELFAAFFQELPGIIHAAFQTSVTTEVKDGPLPNVAGNSTLSDDDVDRLLCR